MIKDAFVLKKGDVVSIEILDDDVRLYTLKNARYLNINNEFVDNDEYAVMKVTGIIFQKYNLKDFAECLKTIWKIISRKPKKAWVEAVAICE